MVHWDMNRPESVQTNFEKFNKLINFKCYMLDNLPCP